MCRITVIALLILTSCSFDEGGIGSSDASSADAAVFDGQVNPPDGPVADARVIDAPPAIDGATPDAPVPDAFVPDGPVPDAFVPDAAIPDAFVADATIPDAFLADASYGVVEMLTVQCDGTIATSTTVLSAGVDYQLRASGTCSIGPFDSDAEYFNFSSPTDTGGTADYGIGIDDTVVDLVKPPNWGAYDASHVYTVKYPGTGAVITARFYDGVGYGNNSGSLTVEILAPN